MLQELGVRVHTLGMPGGSLTTGGLRHLWRLVRATDADVVQTWMYHADLVGGGFARMAGARAIVWGLHNTYLDQRKTRLMVRACAAASRLVPRTIISCSDEAARMHVARGYSRRRMTVVPNGYDLGRFQHDAAARVRLRAEWGIGPDALALGMVARWDPQKDHANLITALSRVGDGPGRPWRLLLVGREMDASNTQLTRLLDAAGLRDRVLLLGQRADIPAVMSALDLHVLSSVAEAFPNVVAEAMACETLCLVTDTGDAALIVGDTGWVVPPRDSAQLAAGLRTALSALGDTDAIQLRRRDARARIEAHFSVERMVESYSRVWQAAADDRPAPS